MAENIPLESPAKLLSVRRLSTGEEDTTSTHVLLGDVPRNRGKQLVKAFNRAITSKESSFSNLETKRHDRLNQPSTSSMSSPTDSIYDDPRPSTSASTYDDPQPSTSAMSSKIDSIYDDPQPSTSKATPDELRPSESASHRRKSGQSFTKRLTSNESYDVEPYVVHPSEFSLKRCFILSVCMLVLLSVVVGMLSVIFLQIHFQRSAMGRMFVTRENATVLVEETGTVLTNEADYSSTIMDLFDNMSFPTAWPSLTTTTDGFASTVLSPFSTTADLDEHTFVSSPVSVVVTTSLNVHTTTTLIERFGPTLSPGIKAFLDLLTRLRMTVKESQ